MYKRQELNLPERQIDIDKTGKVTEVRFKERLDAHKLIEEFMILANVCAAETLSDKKVPTIFRVHEEPEKEKIESLRKTAQSNSRYQSSMYNKVRVSPNR